MKKERLWAVFTDCMRRYRGALLLLVLTEVMNFIVFRLYDLISEPFFYSLIITGFLTLLFIGAVFFRSLYRAGLRERLLHTETVDPEELPPAHSLTEKDYREMLERLYQTSKTLSAQYEEEKRDMQEYYAAWVHQIKTPIAVMRMLLAQEESRQKQELENELFRIEQYVEMVLQYVRLGDDTVDLLIREYSLDDLIRQSIRKFAPQFILKRLKLNYQPTDRKIVTDQKWFACIMDQLLSNAVKYTPSGSVTISVGEDCRLRITDTGIGIAPEDLPRIFEKGYTGSNGRLEKHSSGLGLYLCQKAAHKLSIGLEAESTPGKGSTFILNLKQE